MSWKPLNECQASRKQIKVSFSQSAPTLERLRAWVCVCVTEGRHKPFVTQTGEKKNMFSKLCDGGPCFSLKRRAILTPSSIFSFCRKKGNSVWEGPHFWDMAHWSNVESGHGTRNTCRLNGTAAVPQVAEFLYEGTCVQTTFGKLPYWKGRIPVHFPVSL